MGLKVKGGLKSTSTSKGLLVGEIGSELKNGLKSGLGIFDECVREIEGCFRLHERVCCITRVTRVTRTPYLLCRRGGVTVGSTYHHPPCRGIPLEMLLVETNGLVINLVVAEVEVDGVNE